MPLLQIRNLTHYFGGLRAVHNFHTEIEPGDLKGLIGPNGAGKTTIFNLVTGIYKPTEGEIIFNGTNIVGKRPNEITDLGIGRTFQNMRLWRHLTALDHIKIAFHSKINYGLVGAFFGTKHRREEEEEIEEKSRELLRMMGIEQYADQIILNLPYGIQRKVEIARALATGPRLLLLDEPTAGMSPAEMLEIMDLIQKIREELGLAIWLIEHRMKLVMTICELIQVLDFGEIIAEGPPEEIKKNPRVIKAYLGEEVTV